VWTSRVSIEPAAWSFTYTDYWGTVVTTFELHEPHEALTVHAQAVVETSGDELAWDTDRRVAPNDLGWPALRDRGVIDTMTEFSWSTTAPGHRTSCSPWPPNTPTRRPGWPAWTSAG
jgi:transglutaminase-like putative cysteine protease